MIFLCKFTILVSRLLGLFSNAKAVSSTIEVDN